MTLDLTIDEKKERKKLQMKAYHMLHRTEHIEYCKEYARKNRLKLSKMKNNYDHFKKELLSLYKITPYENIN